MFRMDLAYKLIRACLACVFIYAGFTKLLDQKSFAVLIDAYGLVPESLIFPVALALPILELIAGIGLLFDAQGSLTVIAGLLLVFIAILVYGIWMGLDVDCGCFGPEDPEGDAFHGLRRSLLRDTFMMAGVIFLYAWRWHRNICPVNITFLIDPLLSKRRKEDAQR